MKITNLVHAKLEPYGIIMHLVLLKFMHIRMCVCLCMFVYVCVYVCVSVCVCVCLCVCDSNTELASL